MLLKNENVNLLSVIIPAYNNPQYLRKCLLSLSKQKYKNFEIIISDDCSPLSLEETVNAIKKNFDKNIDIKFFRQKENLGVYWNLIFCLDHCSGSYLTFMQHDDWFIDNDFYLEAIQHLDKNSKLNVIIANSKQELSKQKTMVVDTDDWINMNGTDYVSNHLFYDYMHPIYSTIIYRKIPLIENKYVNYFVTKKDADYMGVEIDECFVALVLAAVSGEVMLTGKVVCVQGKPETAATNLNLHLLKKKGMDVGMFIPYFRLYKYFRVINNSACVNEMKRLIIKKFCVRHINFRVLKYLNWDFQALRLMFLSFSFRCIRKIKSTIT